MEAETREYIRYLLELIKGLYGKIYSLQALLQSCNDPDMKAKWESRLAELLEMPEPKAALDGKFDSHIAKILKTLEDQEAFAVLLRTPTKGLPN